MYGCVLNTKFLLKLKYPHGCEKKAFTKYTLFTLFTPLLLLLRRDMEKWEIMEKTMRAKLIKPKDRAK